MLRPLIFLVLVPAVFAGGLFTGKTYTRDEVRGALVAAGIPKEKLPSMGADEYAQFRESELLSFHALTWHRLTREVGTPVWNPRFTCVAISEEFVTAANRILNREAFHWVGGGFTRAAVLLVAHDTKGPHGHCLLLFLTDRGPRWRDAQSGEARTPTADELATAWRPEM